MSHIEKLQASEQWATWKFQVELALLSGDVLDVVDGSLTRNEENQVLFQKSDNLARMIIGTTVGPSQVTHIKHCKSARDMWVALQTVHEKKDDVTKARLFAQYWNFKIDVNEPIMDAIARLNDIVAQLGNHDEKITEVNKSSRLIDALPREFSSFCSAWDSASATDKTYTSLTQRLQLEEERRGGGESSKEQKESEALMAGKPQCKCPCVCGAGRGNRWSNYDSKRKVKCYGCQEEGHIRRDCPQQKTRHGFAVDQSEALSCEGEGKNVDKWIMDTGASDHICPDFRRFANYSKTRKRIITAGGDIILAEGIGDVELMAFDGKGWQRRVLVGVLHVPKSKYNLFALSKSLDKGCRMNATDRKCEILRGEDIVAIGLRSGNLFLMDFSYDIDSVASVAKVDNLSLYEWHRRMGHQNVQQVKAILNRCNVQYIKAPFQCESCVVGKAHSIPFPKRKESATAVGEIVHADVCGPLQVKSLAGARYFLIFKDEFSHFRHIYFMKTKDEAADLIKGYINLVELQCGIKVKILRSDNGGEFVNKSVN